VEALPHFGFPVLPSKALCGAGQNNSRWIRITRTGQNNQTADQNNQETILLSLANPLVSSLVAPFFADGILPGSA
jgi:hypothetical protein